MSSSRFRKVQKSSLQGSIPKPNTEKVPKKQEDVGGKGLWHRYLPYSIGLFFLAILLYGQSIRHEYTLDDRPVTYENKLTTQGIKGIPKILTTDYWYGFEDKYRGPIYRPSSLVVYALVWEFFPDRPDVLHSLNILTYGMTCFTLFWVLLLLWGPSGFLPAFICSLLWTMHPIHTEVVNTIKSMDEMLCFFFALLSMLLFLKYVERKSLSFFLSGGLAFFLCLISKETGITFLAIIPLSIYFFSGAEKRHQVRLILLLAGLSFAYLGLRWVILHDVQEKISLTGRLLNNTLNAAPDLFSKYMTIFHILFQYIKLLFYPHPLSCDYNYAVIRIQNPADASAWGGLILYSISLAIALYGFKTKKWYSFAILWYLLSLAPVSNFFFLNGSTMAERFMYIPSLGFCILLGVGLMHMAKPKGTVKNDSVLLSNITWHKSLIVLLLSISTFYALKIFSRNVHWKNNLTIFSEDIKTSYKSATANKILGSQLFKSAQDSKIPSHKADTFAMAKRYLLNALKIYPTYSEPWALLGVIYFTEGKYDSAHYYQKLDYEKRGDLAEVVYNYGKTLNKLQKYDDAIPILLKAIKIDSLHAGAHFNLGLAHTNKGDLDQGLNYLLKVIKLDPERERAYYFAGQIYQTKGNLAKAKEYLDASTRLLSRNPEIQKK